ncbi:ATP-binding protein [Streptomyces altiplanensis]
MVLRWSDDPRCVGQARDALRQVLTGWGLSAIEDSAVVILSELLTNAGRHARVPGQDIETRYLRMPGGLRIEVHDGTCKRPSLSTPDGDRDSGRGLWLVDALADRWDVGERAGLGKAVWAEISAPAVDDERPGQGGGEAVSGDGHARVGTVLRFADWTLSPDVSGSEPINEVECTTCHEAPKPSGRSVLEEWCLRHAGRTWHTGFRAITTSFFRVTCHEALPGPADGDA